MVKARFRIGSDGSNARQIAAATPNMGRIGVSAASQQDPFTPWGPLGSASSFEGAGYGRRLKNFNPSRSHINIAIEFAGRTLVKRARYLVENAALAGNAVDVWAAWVVGEGIRPRVPSSVSDEKRKAVRKLWKRWIREADADNQTNYYGMQERVAREVYIAGEVFIRRRIRRPGDMRSVPLQLQLLPSEMLDLSYNINLDNGNYIRMGIEFDKIGRRIAYHFWTKHPDDFITQFPPKLRTRVPAEEVAHIFDARQGQQIRGLSKFARAIVKLFSLDSYNDAELERKRVAALYAGFVTKTGEGSALDNPDPNGDQSEAPELQPGAMVVLENGEDVKFSSPADVGGSYEPFQYRTALEVAAALSIPYAYLTGDMTRGNFSNVRTDIINFRRKFGQHQSNVMIPQFCERVWEWWLDVAELADMLAVDDDMRDESHMPPRMDWVDPRADVDAEAKAVRNGFKTRDQVVASQGGDLDEFDEARARENASADKHGLVYDSDPRRTSAVGQSNAVAPGFGYADPDDEPGDTSPEPVEPKGKGTSSDEA